MIKIAQSVNPESLICESNQAMNTNTMSSKQ